jgi:hypothetical protein
MPSSEENSLLLASLKLIVNTCFSVSGLTARFLVLHHMSMQHKKVVRAFFETFLDIIDLIGGGDIQSSFHEEFEYIKFLEGQRQQETWDSILAGMASEQQEESLVEILAEMTEGENLEA